MTDPTLLRARGGDEDALRELTDPYRRELQLHCYRILGSVQDAEDQLQETLLAAWRGLDRFEGHASARAWLYRIATNRCLDALRARRSRPQEVTRIIEPPEPTRRTEPIWLQPYPNSLLDEKVLDDAPGPEMRYEAKETIALAFTAGLQHLPPQQRAVLVLRDVLGYRADEVAEMLDTSSASVNSLLRRARSAFDSRLPATGRDRAPLPESSAIAPFGVVLLWLVPTRANNQPAVGCYFRAPHTEVGRPYGLLVLRLQDDRTSAITWFSDSSVFPHFGLPRILQ